jgi:predicted Rossmann fold nucleotide-binding protein DprA/Smf involved in DNA uptake
MDPLTLIVTAVTVGAALGLKPVAEQAVKDAYAGLKRIIMDKYNDRKKVVPAVQNLEEDPESEGWKALLKEGLAKLEAGQDEELLQAAQDLLTKAGPEGEKVGSYTIIGDGNVIGSGNVVTVTKQHAGDGAIQIGQARDVSNLKTERDK